MTVFVVYVVITGYLSVGLYKSHPDYVPVDGWHSTGTVRTLVFLGGWLIWPIMLVRTWRAQKRDDAWVESTGAGPQKSYLLQGAFKSDPPKFTQPQRRRQRKSPGEGV